MSLIAEKKDRPLVPEDQYAARCIDVYDAGWWPKMDDPSQFVQKCKLVFVLEGAHEDGSPLYIDIFETLSLGEKANLRKMLTSWRGKQFTDDELRGFDLEQLIGAPALIGVVHKAKKAGGSRAMVGSIVKLPKGMTAPTKPSDYKMDKDRDEPFASKHPAPGAKGAKSLEEAGASVQDEDDDLPF